MIIDQLYIDQSVTRNDEIEYLINKVNLTPLSVQDPKTLFNLIHQENDPIGRAKKILFITNNKGAIIRDCPGTSHYNCCDYTILHTGTFCTMDCSYCILQAYFHPPVLQYFAGLDKMFKQLDTLFKQSKIFRIGTGEYTDSLIWEKISLQPKSLVEYFASQNNCVVELKTKTVNINSLLSVDHNGKTILSWSLNTPQIIDSEERGTASLKSRLNAARQAVSNGYKVAFHFDPLIIYDGCETQYQKVIEQIFKHVSPEDIVWISIGTFRFMPKLKQIIEKRFVDSTICYGEFIQGLDNKMRYFKPLRISLYKKIVSTIREFAPKLFLYFCMEDEEVWKKTMGFFPGKEGELGYLLNKNAAEQCNLNKSLL